MLFLNEEKAEQYVKGAFYGHPGTGKTGLGVSAPSPLIILTERQGMVHIREAAKRLKKPVPPVFLCENLDDLRLLIRALRGDKSKPFAIKKEIDGQPKVMFKLDEWPLSISVDSITDIGKMVARSIDEQAPPKNGSDGLPAHTQNYWQVLGDRMGNIIRDFRDLPFHVLFLALANDTESGDGETRTRWLGPSLPMKRLAGDLSAAVNVIGYTYRTVRRRMVDQKPVTSIHYGVQTVGPEYAITKPYRPLRDHEVPDFAHWIDVINGTAEQSAAPPPSGEMDSGDQSEPQQPKTEPAQAEQTETTEEKPAAAKKAKKGSK
jgi:hypothetical protein